MAKATKPVQQPKSAPVPNAEAEARIRAAYNREQVGPPTGAGIIKRGTEIEKIFLESLAEGYSVSRSAWIAGVHRMTAYHWRRESEATKRDDGSYKDDFCVRWEDAMEAGVDRLEDEAQRRAAAGYERPVYQGGVMVGTTTEYSDALMALMLRGKRPSRYNTERHELSGPGGTAIPTSMEIEFVDSKGKK